MKLNLSSPLPSREDYRVTRQVARGDSHSLLPGFERCASVTASVIILLFVVAVASAQSQPSSASLSGLVRDSTGHTLANVTVHLVQASEAQPSRQGQQPSASSALTTHTDVQGQYRFHPLDPGTYTLSAKSAANGETHFGPFTLAGGDQKVVELKLTSPPNSSALPGFYDEPQFTVAGITQTGNAGGHGSDAVLRTSEALAKETASLSTSVAASRSGLGNSELKKRRGDVRSQLTLSDAAELHHTLADLDEKLGESLQAVREYQRAAELNPSEANLFDWGCELLVHQAPEAAVEVFERGRAAFPKSSRVLVGLGVAQYAKGSNEKALEALFKASDLNPSDPTPYVFLGRIQAVATTESPQMVEKFRRFVTLQPENALANYYYALSLWKQSRGNENQVDSDKMQHLLEKSIDLDPRFSDAHLELGNLLSEKGEWQPAIEQYQKAIEVNSALLEAHYRLGQAYRRIGNNEKAQKELRLHAELSKKSNEQVEQERHEIQRFVVKLRDDASRSQSQ